MIKIQELARLAKVSVATVSRVFNHHPNIRPELRRRVLEVAEQNGYHPRISLKQKHVVIITPYSEVYPSQGCVDMILMALTQEMPRRGFRLEILPANNHKKLEGIQFCAAVAICPSAGDFVDWQKRFPAPLIILDRERSPLHPGIFCVRSDEAQGMKIAIQHLHEHGCRKIGCIIHGEPGEGNAGVRCQAIVRALKSRKLPYDDSLVLFSGNGSEKYVELIGKLLKQKIDGLFCPGGNAGIIALHAFSLYGYKVPENISLIASEQTSFSQYTIPALTSIAPDYRAMAAATADIIESHLYGESSENNIVLPYSLIKRESVGRRHPEKS